MDGQKPSTSDGRPEAIKRLQPSELEEQEPNTSTSSNGVNVQNGKPIVETRSVEDKTPSTLSKVSARAVYDSDISLYVERPSGIPNLLDVEKWTNNRFKTLLCIREASDHGYVYNSDEWKLHILKLLKERRLDDFVELLFNPECTEAVDIPEEKIRRRKIDHISYYMLMGSFAFSSFASKRRHTVSPALIKERMETLLKLEKHMFCLRYSNLDDEHKKVFLRKNNHFQNILLTETEKQRLSDDLYRSTLSLLDKKDIDVNKEAVATAAVVKALKQRRFAATDFYKVHYTKCEGSVIGNVKCHILKGYCYVPHYMLNETNMIDIYTKSVAGLLKYWEEAVEMLDDNHQLLYLFSNVMAYEVGIESLLHHSYGRAGCASRLNQLEDLCYKSFPLCARNAYEALKRFHFLKYEGRNLLQLFLKGIGLSCQDNIAFFRRHVGRRLNEKTFGKDYVYGIKHKYGLVGGRRPYHPPSCMNVRGVPVKKKEYHGCPYEVFPEQLLRKCLQSSHIDIEDIDQIVEKKKKGQAQLACTHFFECTHGRTSPASGNISHPNQFFEDSRTYFKNLTSASAESKASTPKAEPVASTSKTEPAASTSKAQPVASTSKAEPVASTSKTEPAASTSKAQPIASTSKAEPVASTSKTEPAASTLKAQPIASTSKAEPVVSTTKSQPVASTLKVQPIPSTSKTEPVVSTTKSQPVASTSKAQPVASTSKTEPVADSIANQLDDLCHKSFPLCARNAYEAFKRFHSLPYEGRNLLQLFLKGIGLSCEDNIEFFRTHVGQRLDGETFRKNYEYTIKYKYGLVGGRRPSDHPSCVNVRRMVVNKNEFHGCPYQRFPEPLLRKCLQSSHIDIEDIDQIVGTSKKGQAQLACTQFFECTHGRTSPASGNVSHPNQFFKDSRAYFKLLATSKAEHQNFDDTIYSVD